MLVWSEYLKELGYKKSDFPFNKTARQDPRYALDKKTGTVQAQTWNLETTIILEMYVYLRDFQDHYMKIGTPVYYASKPDGSKEYHKLIQEIIDSLKARIQAYKLESSDFETYEDYIKAQDELIEKFEHGWKLLGENIACLWW